MMRRWLWSTGAWLEHRLGLKDSVWPMMRHPVPRGANWWYVFGSATMTLLIIQIVTGICLALVYVPSPDQAFESLEYLNYHQYMGWFLRALHYWAATGMVCMLFVHLTQVFLFGAFKYPRELTWIVGVGLLACTLFMGFSGQVLRWDQDAYWGVGVGASMAGRVPIIGPQVVELLLGGTQIGAPTLSRFFALHVFVVPGLLISLLVLHLYLVLRKGISEPPVPGKPVDPKTYEAEYEEKLKGGEPFFPDSMWRDAIFSFLTILVAVGVAAYLGPYGPRSVPDPTLIQANPRPDWYFLWLFALLALSPPEAETFIMLVLPVLLFGILIVIPFVSNTGERSWRRRPIAVLSVISVFVTFVVLTYLGFTSPWSPEMEAWSATTVPENMIQWTPDLKKPEDKHTLSPVQLQGAVVLQNKNCRNCHALDGKGGHRGPDLTDVATRLTRDELIRQVIQGGGNMPAYGKQLKPAEVDALVDFLGTLRPKDQPGARSSASLSP
ncbi:MAG: cytochrome b N-terminal domain-containing protein [Gemmataceae bacterium]|nr:cytochrome b N-terminal domain-containing protein [Gemmataceae bacterium]